MHMMEDSHQYLHCEMCSVIFECNYGKGIPRRILLPSTNFKLLSEMKRCANIYKNKLKYFYFFNGLEDTCEANITAGMRCSLQRKHSQHKYIQMRRKMKEKKADEGPLEPCSLYLQVNIQHETHHSVIVYTWPYHIEEHHTPPMPSLPHAF